VERQHLAARSADPLQVISDICGLHAQVLSSAQLTLSARVEEATRELARRFLTRYVVAAPREDRATSAPERIYRPGGWFSPVLRVAGVMAGVWAREADAVTIEPFAATGRDVRAAAEAEAARLRGAPTVIWQA
jgi:hypothetical protein